jgi:hypothetical protein
MAQLVVIDQIFVAQRNPEYALPDQCADLMLNQFGCAAIGETRSKPLDQSDRPVRRPQQQGPGIRGHPTAVKMPPPPRAVRRVQIRTDPRYTLSASGVPLTLRQTVVTARFSQIQDPDAPTPFEKSRLVRHSEAERRSNR